MNITGGGGNDLLVGTAGADVMSGGGRGQDTIQGGGGDDLIYAGGGGDITAVFTGNRADYTISLDNAGNVMVADNRPGSPEGTDNLQQVNHLQFADVTVGPPILSVDLSGSADSFLVTFDANAGSGTIEDVTTGTIIPIAGILSLSVTTGSGDDAFVVTGSQDSFNFDGGGGQNHFTGDLRDAYQQVDFRLDSTPGATSSLGIGFPQYTSNSLTNIQTVDLSTNGAYSTLIGGDGADRLDSGSGYQATVDGGAGDDTVSGGFDLRGGDGDDVLYAGSAAQRYRPTVMMTGGSGDDTLYGNGIVGVGPYNQAAAGDIAYYSGDRADYTVSTDSVGVTTIADLRPGSPDGTDTLINVAELQFADSTVDLLTGPVVTASSPSNGLVEAGFGTTGVSSAVVTLQLADSVGTPVYLDGGGAPLGAGQIVLSGVYGSAVLDTVANTLTYTLDDSLPATNALAGWQQTDELFQITIGDASGFQSQAYVDFSIQGTNDAPTPAADSATAAYATPLTISAASLLANDSDPEGDALSLTAVGGAQHGTVSLSGGAVTFTPYVGYVGAAGFSYTVDDGNGGTATGQVALTVTGTSPGYIYRAGVTASETIDTTGDASNHNIVTGSGDDSVFTGSGGSSVKLGAGDDVVVGGSGKDIVTFGAGLDTVTGGAGPDNFIFVKGQIADPATHGGRYDTVTDFTGAGSAYMAGRDFISLKGFASTATITYEHDLAGDPAAHLYRVDDGAYHAEFVLAYAGAGVNLNHSQYGFL